MRVVIDFGGHDVPQLPLHLTFPPGLDQRRAAEFVAELLAGLIDEGLLAPAPDQILSHLIPQECQHPPLWIPRLWN